MASVVGLCNIALLGLGANTISSLTETSTEAVVCNAMWDTARQSLLRSYPWKFSIKRVELALSTDTLSHGYTNSFQLPSDCLSVISVQYDTNYKVENNKRVNTNRSECFVIYVSDIEDVNEWDSSFQQAMAGKIRAEIAYTITRSTSQTDMSYSLFDKKVLEAQIVDSQQDMEDILGPKNSPLISARF